VLAPIQAAVMAAQSFPFSTDCLGLANALDKVYHIVCPALGPLLPGGSGVAAGTPTAALVGAAAAAAAVAMRRELGGGASAPAVGSPQGASCCGGTAEASVPCCGGPQVQAAGRCLPSAQPPKANAAAAGNSAAVAAVSEEDDLESFLLRLMVPDSPLPGDVDALGPAAVAAAVAPPNPILPAAAAAAGCCAALAARAATPLAALQSADSISLHATAGCCGGLPCGTAAAAAFAQMCGVPPPAPTVNFTVLTPIPVKGDNPRLPSCCGVVGGKCAPNAAAAGLTGAAAGGLKAVAAAGLTGGNEVGCSAEGSPSCGSFRDDLLSVLEMGLDDGACGLPVY